MTKSFHQIISNCIMDASASNIKFDAQGRCDYCNNSYSNALPSWHMGNPGAAEPQHSIDAIKRGGEGKPQDGIVGISGGIDCSYMTNLAMGVASGV
jgi:hypothetical protein